MEAALIFFIYFAKLLKQIVMINSFVDHSFLALIEVVEVEGLTVRLDYDVYLLLVSSLG